MKYRKKHFRPSKAQNWEQSDLLKDIKKHEKDLEEEQQNLIDSHGGLDEGYNIER